MWAVDACTDGVDNDCDGLTDAVDPDCVDSDGDGLSDVFEQNILGTLPDTADSDDDRLDDGVEVANGSDPTDAGSWPRLADGDCAPKDAPNGETDTGDLVFAMRLAFGHEVATPLELAHCDLAPASPDDAIDARDILLLTEQILTP